MVRQDCKTLSVRLSAKMLSHIRIRAKGNHRSMNAEIVHCIERYLADVNEKGPVEVAASPSHVTHQTA